MATRERCPFLGLSTHTQPPNSALSCCHWIKVLFQTEQEVPVIKCTSTNLCDWLWLSPRAHDCAPRRNHEKSSAWNIFSHAQLMGNKNFHNASIFLFKELDTSKVGRGQYVFSCKPNRRSYSFYQLLHFVLSLAMFSSVGDIHSYPF